MNLRWPLSGTLGDELYLLGFIAFFTLPFLTYIGMILTGVRRLPPAKAGGAGRRLLGPVFIGYYYWLLGPLFRAVSRTRLRPNQITGASLVAAGLTATAIATGHFALASALLIGGSSLDMIDGQLARAKRMSSASGAFFDSTIDRVCDGLMFAGCVVYYAGSPMMLVSLLVLVTSFTVSYARSRAETLGVSGAEGLMQRGDRIAVLGTAMAFSPFFAHRAEGFVAHPLYAVTAGALCVLAVLNTFTAVTRIAWTMRALKEGAPINEGATLNLVRPRGDVSPRNEVAPRVEVLRPAAGDPGPLLNQRARSNGNPERVPEPSRDVLRAASRAPSTR